MMVPMMDPTAWPPRAGAASTSTTLRPSFAASRAADTPAMPAPRTHTSATTVFAARVAGRCRIRVAIVSDMGDRAAQRRSADYKRRWRPGRITLEADESPNVNLHQRWRPGRGQQIGLIAQLAA